MVAKIISATEARIGTNILIEGEPYMIKKFDVSKTGKHGHAKCRIEAVGVINNQKKVFVVPGTDRFEVPMIEKKRAQVLSLGDTTASVMDLESFETLEISCPDDVKSELEVNSNVEYWDIEGEKIIKRKV